MSLAFILKKIIILRKLKLIKMKKILSALFLSVLCIGYTPTTQAQEGYVEKKIYLDLGIGASRYGHGWSNNLLNNSYSYKRYSTPTLRANVEYGFNHFISGGLYAEHNSWRRKGTQTVDGIVYDYREKGSNLSLGARATFHVWAFLNNHLNLGLGVEQLDLYASVMTGVRIQQYMHKDFKSNVKDSGVYTHFGPTIGAKYYFLDNLSVFAEAGYGPSSFGIVGVGLKF